MNDPSKSALLSGTAQITAKNISSEPVQQGKEDLHVIFLYDSAFQMEADSNTTDQNNERPRPALTKGQTFQRDLAFTASNYGEKLKYILAVGRVFK
ncbi:hypothetical protein D3C84_853360 [compost metagenome]